MGPPKHPRPLILFHDISHARAIAAATLAFDRPVDALAAPDAARALGASILKAITDEAALTEALIDCASSSENVQLALRAGWKRILFDTAHPACEPLTKLTEACNAELLPRAPFLAAAPATLDLLRQSDPLQCCKDFLKNF